MMRAARIALFSAAALVALSAPARAEEDPWAGIEVMEDDELAELRGGIRVAEGLDIGFGAVITSYANGVPVLQTQLNWTDAGAIVEHTYGSLGRRIDELPAEARAVLGIEGMDNAGGVVIADADGVTALMHNITDGALQNIIVNNASGRALSQNIDVTLTLPNFEAMQDMFSLQRLGLRLDADMAAAAAGS
jgi:hypothetical protein